MWVMRVALVVVEEAGEVADLVVAALRVSFLAVNLICIHCRSLPFDVGRI